jgi:membrane protein implicated in regulation of membrane protease activity
MEQYLNTLINRRNTLTLFLFVNLCAVVGGVVAHYVNLPVWASFVACLAIVLLSPLWSNWGFTNGRGLSRDKLQRTGATRAGGLVVNSRRNGKS